MVTTQTAKSDTCPRGKSTFVKDAVIGCKITTDGAWTAETNDLAVVVFAIVTLAGI